MIKQLITDHNNDIAEAMQLAKKHFDPLKDIFHTVQVVRIIKPGLWESFRRLLNQETYEKQLLDLNITYGWDHEGCIHVTVVFYQGAWTYTYGEGGKWDPMEQRESLSEKFTMSDLKPDSNFQTSATVKKFIARIVHQGKEYHKDATYTVKS